jgi:hypothetical protein
MTSLRVLTWCCVILLAALSLLPAQEMVRTGLPGGLEHFVAYTGSAAIAMAGYGASRGSVQIVGGFWVYAGILEYFPVGIRRSLISRRRRLERCAAVLLSPCSGVACPPSRVEGCWLRWGSISLPEANGTMADRDARLLPIPLPLLIGRRLR